MSKHPNDERLFQRRRADLVDELRHKGIRDERVLAALGRVPRHLFVDPALEATAYYPSEERRAALAAAEWLNEHCSWDAAEDEFLDAIDALTLCD